MKIASVQSQLTEGSSPVVFVLFYDAPDRQVAFRIVPDLAQQIRLTLFPTSVTRRDGESSSWFAVSVVRIACRLPHFFSPVPVPRGENAGP